MKLNVQNLELAFQGRPDIVGAVKVAATAPEWIELFNEVSAYVADLRDGKDAVKAAASREQEPAGKKRRLDEKIPNHPGPNGRPTNASRDTPAQNEITASPAALAAESDEVSLLAVKDISFVLPLRKKFTIEVTNTRIRARQPESQEVITGIDTAWRDIAYAFCLPVPEKAQKQYNYVLFPKNTNLPSPGSVPRSSADPLIFTIPAAAPKVGAISGRDAGKASSFSDTHKDVFDWILSSQLDAAGNKVKIIEASEKQFVSAQKEAHRPKEKALFVKAFRGSKDGYLFFLEPGILFAFKKPVLFIPRSQAIAVSYTNVLQRTFNLNIEVYLANDVDSTSDPASQEEQDEFEFAMLDQEDFQGIDTYVKRHGLQDASMAEQRRAKRLGINDVKGGKDGEDTAVPEHGDLEAAEEQALQDEEDEEEEDYDPGSEGESEGEGSSSDEEEDGGDGGQEIGNDNDADDDDDNDGGG